MSYTALKSWAPMNSKKKKETQGLNWTYNFESEAFIHLIPKKIPKWAVKVWKMVQLLGK